MASHLGHGSMAVYGSAKAGILGLTKACASSWAPDNIQVNAVDGGFIWGVKGRAPRSGNV